MRILCDQHVPVKYVTALRDAEGMTVTTVDAALQHDATDAEIAGYAESEGWVVFTNDDDFFVDRGGHGLLLYSQLEDPPPGVVVAAVREIGRAYGSADEIVETVPGQWA